jgi:hypothetical protein
MLIKNESTKSFNKDLKIITKNIENNLFSNTIYNIDFLINAILVLIKNAHYQHDINIILENYILIEIKKNINKINIKDNDSNFITGNNLKNISLHYLKKIKRIIGVCFKNLSPTLLNTENEVFTIENKLECALHMLFTVKLEKNTADNVISKYYDYYYSIDDNKCNLNFGIYDNPEMNDIKKNIILDGIHLFIKKCLELKIEFSNEDSRHVKLWNIKSLNKSDLDNSTECPICLESHDSNSCVTTNCKHSYCGDCFKNMINMLKPYHSPICPLCRSSVEELHVNSSKEKDFIVI